MINLHIITENRNLEGMKIQIPMCYHPGNLCSLYKQRRNYEKNFRTQVGKRTNKIIRPSVQDSTLEIL